MLWGGWEKKKKRWAQVKFFCDKVSTGTNMRVLDNYVLRDIDFITLKR